MEKQGLLYGRFRSKTWPERYLEGLSWLARANEQPIDGKKEFLERPKDVDVNRRSCLKVSNVARKRLKWNFGQSYVWKATLLNALTYAEFK